MRPVIEPAVFVAAEAVRSPVIGLRNEKALALLPVAAP
jgi:hypothetical protein